MEEYERPALKLSRRELEILSLLAQGKSSKQIATLLNLGVETVRSHRKKMMKTLGVSNMAGLITVALRSALIQGPAEAFPTAGSN